jgi:hypothetical protein
MAVSNLDRLRTPGQPTASDRVWADPSLTTGQSAKDRAPFYARCFAYYSNDAYKNLMEWSVYKDKNWLYQLLRNLYNPYRRIVEFYVGEVYPGLLTVDGSKFPEGVSSAIPLSEDTPEPLKKAIGQFWQWSNWQSGKDLTVRYGAMAGNVLVELIDDLGRRKVTTDIHWPSKVADLSLDPSGNLKFFALEYASPVLNADGRWGGETYVYRKEVSNKTIKTFKDGEPFDYTLNQEDGPGAEVTHGYGFCPGVWYKHFDIGGVFGQPVMWATLGKIDEVNSLASMIHDQIGKIVNSPVAVMTEGAIAKLTEDAQRNKTASPSTREEIEQRKRDKVKLIHLPPGSHMETLPLEMGPAVEVLDHMLRELERDHPELAMYEQLQQMSTVSGIAVTRLMGNVANLVYSAEAAYDTPSVSLFRMAVAMAGQRVKNGDWERLPDGTRVPLTEQHQAFASFDLESYAAGKLNFDIMPRPIIEVSQLEIWQADTAKAAALNAKAASPGLSVPTEVLQKEWGYDDKEIASMSESAKAAQQNFGADLLRAINNGGGQTPIQGQSQPPSNASQGLSNAPTGNQNGRQSGQPVGNPNNNGA